MNLIEKVHGGYVHERRVRVLVGEIAPFISPGARVLDVGCGDGLLSRLVRDRRPDVHVEGIDVLVRPSTHVPVTAFDGARIPFPDGAFETVMMVDVLHHTTDPMVLLREAVRVAGREVIIKDHTMDGPLSGPILRFMDRVANERHGVDIVYNYWPTPKWRQAFDDLKVAIDGWNASPALYPFPANLLFGRGLHFIAKLVPRHAAAD